MNIHTNTVFIRIEAPGAKAKFWGVPLFEKSKDLHITGPALQYNLDCILAIQKFLYQIYL